MDECLDWQGRELPRAHPYSFRGFMEQHFYDPIEPRLAVPSPTASGSTPATSWRCPAAIAARPDRHHLRRLGPGWPRRLQPGPPPSLQPDHAGRPAHLHHPHPGQQPRHDPGSGPADLRRRLPVRTAHVGDPRHEGSASRRTKVRLFSDTGAWKQTALRVALFGPLTPEYPMTLLQEHPDALLTATVETAATRSASTRSGIWDYDENFTFEPITCEVAMTLQPFSWTVKVIHPTVAVRAAVRRLFGGARAASMCRPCRRGCPARCRERCARRACCRTGTSASTRATASGSSTATGCTGRRSRTSGWQGEARVPPGVPGAGLLRLGLRERAGGRGLQGHARAARVRPHAASERRRTTSWRSSSTCRRAGSGSSATPRR